MIKISILVNGSIPYPYWFWLARTYTQLPLFPAWSLSSGWGTRLCWRGLNRQFQGAFCYPLGQDHVAVLWASGLKLRLTILADLRSQFHKPFSR